MLLVSLHFVWSISDFQELGLAELLARSIAAWCRLLERSRAADQVVREAPDGSNGLVYFDVT